MNQGNFTHPPFLPPVNLVLSAELPRETEKLKQIAHTLLQQQYNTVAIELSEEELGKVETLFVLAKDSLYCLPALGIYGLVELRGTYVSGPPVVLAIAQVTLSCQDFQ